MNTSSSTDGSKRASRSEPEDEPLAPASPSLELLEFLGEFTGADGEWVDPLDLDPLDRDGSEAAESEDDGVGVD